MGNLKPTIPRISVTPEEAALSTGFARTRIFEAIRNGKLIARGDGKSTVIEFDELARWVHEMPARPARDAAPSGE